MKVSVSGRKIDIGSSLREHVENGVDAIVSKYFDNAIDADVVFSKESHLFVTDIIVNEGSGGKITIKGQAKEDEIHSSFEAAVDKIEKQLRRYKRRLKNHHKKDVAEIAFAGSKYIINDAEEDKGDDNPLIIAEKETAIETITVSDAVMRMNLANLPALMFINKKNGNINIVYRREDGNISWVDSEMESRQKVA